MAATVVAKEVHALLERDSLLDRLGDALGEATAGRGSVVFVAGEAGAGKTALVRRFCELHARSARILRGSGAPLFTPRPLGPILELGENVGGELASVLQTDAVPFHVAAALARELGGDRPTILVLEDLHWADEATLDVLRLVASRISGLPSVVVSTYREESLGPMHQLRMVLGELATNRSVGRLRIPPLTLEAVTRLAEPHGRDPHEIHRITGGNAFFVTEVIAGGGEKLPATVRDAVLARAAFAGEQARAVLEAVAILPPNAELWLLERLTGTIDDRLDDCLESGVLVASPDSVSYRHELARLAVEESISVVRRATLHRAALDALRAPPNDTVDPIRLTHHAAAAGDGNAVLEFAPQAAARASSVGAHREAAALYHQVLRFSELLEPKALAALLRRYSHECYLTDQADEAIAALERAAECYRTVGDRLREGKTLCGLSGILWCPGRGHEALGVGREAVAILEALPPGRELAGAYGNLSFLSRTRFELEAAHDYATRALALASTTGDVEATVGARMAVGYQSVTLELDTAELEYALGLAEQAGLEDHVGVGLLGLAEAFARHRRYEQAAEYIDRGVAYCSEHGIDLYSLYLVALLARVELDRGRWDAAADAAGQVLHKRMVSTAPRTSALVVLALVRARRGDPGSEPLLAEARDLAEPTRELARIAPVAAARAEIAWLRGDFAQVEAATEDALELAVHAQYGPIIGELRSWRRRAGVREPVEAGLPDQYAAELAGRLEEAAAVWDQLGCPYEAALTLAEADEVDALRRAHAELQRLGARPAAAIVARRLRERGVRGLSRGPRRGTRSSPAGLTPRETEVLALIVVGLSNAEIAARLFLSTRTIDHHVSAILRKLDVPSRSRASAEAVRLGMAAPAL